MSVLSDLETELGLPPFDLSLMSSTDLNIYKEVDNTASYKYSASKESTEECINDNIERNMLNPFDSARVAAKMGVPITNITNLYLQIKNLKSTTGDSYLKDLCNELLDGLIQNNITRDRCNQIIVQLNRGRNV